MKAQYPLTIRKRSKSPTSSDFPTCRNSTGPDRPLTDETCQGRTKIRSAVRRYLHDGADHRDQPAGKCPLLGRYMAISIGNTFC